MLSTLKVHFSYAGVAPLGLDKRQPPPPFALPLSYLFPLLGFLSFLLWFRFGIFVEPLDCSMRTFDPWRQLCPPQGLAYGRGNETFVTVRRRFFYFVAIVFSHDFVRCASFLNLHGFVPPPLTPSINSFFYGSFSEKLGLVVKGVWCLFLVVNVGPTP
ncbi:hypothetical protein V6N13_074580 [Hibiscus sabdariffa]